MYWNIKCYLLNTSFKKFYLHAQSVVSTQIWRVIRIDLELFKNQISAQITWCISRYPNISVQLFIFLVKKLNTMLKAILLSKHWSSLDNDVVYR